MLEILMLIGLTKKIGEICKEKGRAAGGYKFLAVVLWFGGEILGAIFGVMIDSEGLGLYLFALLGAAAGAGIAYMIANNLEPARMPM